MALLPLIPLIPLNPLLSLVSLEEGRWNRLELLIPPAKDFDIFDFWVIIDDWAFSPSITPVCVRIQY